MANKYSYDFVIESRGFKTPCWTWLRSIKFGKVVGGYGLILVKGKQRLAHKGSYEDKHGQVPVGLELDHLCRNRDCINPDHLEPVPHATNIRRGKCSTINHGIASTIRRRYKSEHLSQKDLAREYGISQTQVSKIVIGLSWPEGAVI